MKRTITKILSFLICGTLLFATACKKNNNPVRQESEGRQYTSTVLADNGKTDYKIVVAREQSDYIEFAVEELVNLFEEATGATLPVVYDDEVGYSETAKLISIGETAVKQASGVEVPYDEFLTSGARLVNKGDCVILVGGTDRGSLYAVYDFLQILFNYEYYDMEVYTIDKADKVYLPVLDDKDIPTYDIRYFGDALSEASAGGNIHNAWRLRLVQGDEDVAVTGHAATSYIIKPSVYNNPSVPETYHPDWFTAPGTGDFDTTLCYSNKEMQAEFIKNIEKILDQYPTATIIGVEQADVNAWCHCEDCTAAIRKYNNGSDSIATWGAITQTLFMNEVAEEVNAWLAEKYPGRHVTYRTLAYQETVQPPAHKDENGNWIPNGAENGDYSMVLHPDIQTFYADIYANRNKSFRENPSTSANIAAWGALTDNFVIYEYPQNANHVCLPYDGMHTHAENLRFASEFGFKAYNFQGNFNTRSSGFYMLRAYALSKLMWNVNLDPNELADNYIKAVFGEASDVMGEYYAALRTRLAYLRETYDYGSFVLPAECKESYWPRALMLRYQEFFDEAYEAIDSVRYTDPDRYDTLFIKLKTEEMFVKFVNCSLYLTNYSPEEKTKEIDDFEYYAGLCGFSRYSESKLMSEIIAQWRNS